MKLFLMAAILIAPLLTTTAIAQFTPGRFYAGGSLGGSTGFTDGDERGRRVSLSPLLGYVLSDSSSIGLNPVYTWNKDTEGHETMIIGFWRRDIIRNDPFGLFMTIGSMINHSTNRWGTTKDELWGAGIGLTPGLYWFPVERLSIDATLGGISYFYDRRYTNDELESRNHWLSASFESRLWNLSLMYHFK